MKDLSNMMAQKSALQRQITEWTEQVKRLTEEQGRLRSNVQSLVSNQPKEQELRAKWVAAMAANEDQLRTAVRNLMTRAANSVKWKKPWRRRCGVQRRLAAARTLSWRFHDKIQRSESPGHGYGRHG